MERECFEDQEVADILNKDFISIKVDREERPDIDHIYMNVCQALTGHGGWPLTIFMTPDKKPFFAGTYFPKNNRMGMHGLLSILDSVHAAWVNNRDTLFSTSEKILNAINERNGILEPDDDEDLSDDIFYEAFSEFKYDFDNVFGGFGSAPKFPTPHNLFFLLRYWYNTKEDYALTMVEKTLEAMHKGGIYDHIGFGFSRYSTDKKWLVPHFEKMLYDNALLAIAYLEVFQVTKKREYANIAHEIFTYVLRDMTSKEGGFYSAEDADSEGEEGKFYVWSTNEVKKVLGNQDGEKYCKYYDITTHGNFEGNNIPNLIKLNIPQEEKEFIEECRKKLFDYREKRIHPYKDDKILTSWNGLMIAAMAIGGRVLGDERYTKAAEKAVDFIFSKLVTNEGRLLARYRDGDSAFPAYVDDYAFITWGLIELYETTYKPIYLKRSLKLNDDLIKYFWDENNGGLFYYGNDGEQLITRPKEIYDGATPSGNSVATMNFLRLARLTGQSELEAKAYSQFKAFGRSIERFARGHSFFLSALLFAKSKSQEVVLVGNEALETNSMVSIIRENFRPFTLSMFYSNKHEDLKDLAPFIENYKPVKGKTTAYVCENFACQAPITDNTQFRDAIDEKL